jgi:hypothetical protein
MKLFNYRAQGKKINSWFIVDEQQLNAQNDSEILQNLSQRLIKTQVWFSDLDDSDAKSPGKEIALKHAVGTSHFNPEYWGWVVETAFTRLIKDKQVAETSSWKNYIDSFLRSPESMKEIQQIFTDEKIERTLFPGVEDFYSLLPAEKYYVTRNISEVAKVYANYLKFQDYFSESDSKGKVVEDFILKNPQIEHYGVSGDSEDDQEMVDVINFYSKRKPIELLVSLYITNSRNKLNDSFLVNISRDRTGLVELIRPF